MKTPTVLCLLADGFEEIEALAPIDLLRRANCEVVLASISEYQKVKGRNGITVIADALLSDTRSLDAEGKPIFDALLIPGGPGVNELRKDGRAARLAAAYHKAGAWIAAICAAPTVLLDAGLLVERKFTAHFSVRNELPQALDERVVIDCNMITSRGAGTALDFGLALVEALTSTQKKAEVSASIML